MESFLNDFRPVGISADQWTTTAQDEGEWRRTAEQGGEGFMARERQGWTTAQCSLPERDGKDQGQDNPKQAGSCWFARHS